MRAKYLFLALTLLGTVGILPHLGVAASPANISISVAPENPAPKEEVVVSLSSYVNNLDSVAITWSVGGKTAAVGIGKKSFSVVAPEAGAEMRITASIALPDGTVEKTVVLRPAVMALLWQANDSYVPPFYRGKALPAVGSEIKIVAMPEIQSGFRTINPKSMVYVWKKDYENEPGASGYARNFYIYTTDYLENSNLIGVTASTTDQKYFSTGTATVGAFEPQISFYETDPNLGTLWERALPDGHVIAGEEIIVAAPYFLSPKNINVPSLSWDWSINDTHVAAAIVRPNVLPVRADTGTSGASSIGLEITHKYNLLTSVMKKINVEF